MASELELVERWPGYNEQSWEQRFAELDRRYEAASNQLQDLALSIPDTITRLIAERDGQGWQPIETAPYAINVLAGRFDADAGEWYYAVVLSPPLPPFTYWRPLPEPPARSLLSSGGVDG